VLNSYKDGIMKKILLPAAIVAALFFVACQNPAAGFGSPGMKVTIDAVSSATRFIGYYASYQIDSLRLHTNSIAGITMICDYDTVLIDAGNVVYGYSTNVININPEYIRTVYAFAEFVTVDGDVFRDRASISFTTATGAKYPNETRIMRINTANCFKMTDLFDDHIFHLYSTDPAKKYSVSAPQYASQVVKPAGPLLYGSFPNAGWVSMSCDVRFPNPGQSQSFLVRINSKAGGMIDSFVCPTSFICPNADTLSLQLSDASFFGPTSVPNLFEKIRNLDSITGISLDTVNPFRKSYTAADFRNAEEVRQENTRFFPSLGNTSFYLDNSYFYFEIPFENLYINLCYTLQIEFPDGRPPVTVFNNVAFPELVHAGSQW
jgi:hypothetical protein